MTNILTTKMIITSKSRTTTPEKLPIMITTVDESYPVLMGAVVVIVKVGVECIVPLELCLVVAVVVVVVVVAVVIVGFALIFTKK